MLAGTYRFWDSRERNDGVDKKDEGMWFDSLHVNLVISRDAEAQLSFVLPLESSSPGSSRAEYLWTGSAALGENSNLFDGPDVALSLAEIMATTGTNRRHSKGLPVRPARVAAYKILGYLKEHAKGETWIAWRDVLRATHVNEYGPSTVARALSAMVFAGDIEEASIKSTKGPKKQLVRLTIEG